MFGASKPFGGSGFGSTSSTFGTQTTPFGGTTGGLFGSKTSAPSGTFGTPAFGSATPSSTGLFGSSSSTGGTNLFGSKPTQANTGFGFCATSSGGLFGSTTTSSIFQTSQQPSSFPFGGGVSATGTAVKFVPPTSSEQAQKSGISMTIKTQNQCITVMDQYKGKSVEELRMEDYTAGRKTGGASAFGTTATGTGLFGGQTSTVGGLFGGTTTTSGEFAGFGKTGASGGLFGTKTTSLFGSTATATPAFGSGASSSGLFGKSSAGTGLFASTTTTASTGLFGGSGFNSISSSGSLFGGTFGHNASQSTNLFGQTSKPSLGFGPSTGSGFGTTSSGGLFGTASSSGGLFGSTTNKPSFSFGGASSGFGSIGFGTTSSNGSLFGGTSTGGLFGSKPSVFGTTGFGATSSSGGSSLFGGVALGFGKSLSTGTGLGVTSNSMDPYQQQELVQQQVKAIANAPFGDSPLFRNLSEPSKTKSTQSTTNTSKSLNTSQYKILTHPVAHIKPLPVTSQSLGKSCLFQSLEEESDFSPYPLDPPRSIKKLVLKSNKNHSEIVSPCEQDGFKLFLRTDRDNDLVAPSPEVVKTKVAVTDVICNLSNGKSQFIDTISELNLKDHEVTKVADDSNIETEDDQIEQLPKCEMKLTRPEYFIIPSITELDKQVDVDHCQCLVDGFTVGREGYGQVKFLGETNVYGLDLDNIITFRRKEVEVYPDDYPNKPEEGKELNKPAEITLLKVWPTDKRTHTPIKTPQYLKECRFIDHIEKKTTALGADFIDYQPKQGAWVFKVNHFTTYGFLEEHCNSLNAD